MESPAALLAAARRRRPALDHLLRAWSRYGADAGDRLAAAVTFYWFLSLFPILLLAISLLGYVYGDSAAGKVQDALGGVLPSQLVDTIGMTLTQAKGPAGVIGLVGTLLSGLGWIEGLREAIRTLWHQNVLVGNIVVKKLNDIVVLVGLFATIGASVIVTGLATSFSSTALDLLGVQASVPARLFTRLLGLALSLLADTALFLFLYSRLSKVKSPVRRIVKGAVFGAVGFEVLKVVGAFYVARTTSKGEATYGTFAVVVGLLLFLNLFTRLMLFTAAWIVTGPYDSDIAPSGTASPELAREAGMPVEFADAGPDDPAAIQQDGAPTRLQPAVLGRTPSQDEPTAADERADTPGRERATDARPAAHADAPRPGSSAHVDAARTAAHVAAGAGATVLLGVGVYAVRSLRHVVRR